MSKLLKFTSPNHSEVYLAFDDDGYIHYKIYQAFNSWLLESDDGYIQAQEIELETILKKWSDVFTLE